jgi:hypothetical protein
MAVLDGPLHRSNGVRETDFLEMELRVGGAFEDYINRHERNGDRGREESEKGFSTERERRQRQRKQQGNKNATCKGHNLISILNVI